MNRNPTIVREIAGLRAAVAGFRAAGQRVALVPTMGALHDGHLALVDAGRAVADRVVVSVFVNPTQFSPSEDLQAYPRDEAGDLQKLGERGVDAAFLPRAEVMYPPGFATSVTVAGLSEGLCGAYRPQMFQGVATVVTKLLLQALPDAAVFGEKDYQQLLVIRRLAKDLDIPVKIIGAPTVRADNGLALSSRNAYLSAEERRVAPVLYHALSGAANAIGRGEKIETALAAASAAILAAGFAGIDYLELRDAETLAPLAQIDRRPGRLLAAAWLGRARLIDNVPVVPPLS
jgi:pantoate--beta-alanine ligase